jgi:5-methylcytosine-specific restriction endonuclease McrA
MAEKRTSPERRRTRRFKEAAYFRQEGLCAWCGEFVPFEQATGDHVTEISEGGRATRANIVMACAPCNNLRSNPPQHDEHVKLFWHLSRHVQHIREWRRHAKRQDRSTDGFPLSA